MPKPLQASTPSDREVRVVRSFDAPRQLVWDAYTKPELVKKWMLGPPDWTMSVCEMDVRAGGAFRWRWRNTVDGKEFGFFGTFKEVVALSRIVHEENYDPGDIGGPMSTEPAIITTTFEESNGVTTVTVDMLFPSKEARDGAMASGMTDGMEMSYTHLDSLCAAKAA